ncbi:peptidoglycan-binding protein [Pseudophaeobacter sp.]|uniref:peptidoglycan-binding protein n=1 Tax=Pseudophaeobacter sp. TaxID=1971739 RepID=UPI004059BEF8
MNTTKLWAVLVWGITFALTATSSHANIASSIKCVQDQLNQSGFAAGPVDGLFGRRTHRALQAFAQKNGMPTEPPLIKENANVYCRRLGLINPDLQEFWPARTKPFEITAAPSVAPTAVTQIEEILHDLFVQVPAKLGLELAGTEQILVAVTPDEVIKLASATGRPRSTNTSAYANEYCPPTIGAAGQAMSGHFWICVPAGVKEFSGKSLAQLKFVLAHELTHSIQFQVSGIMPRPVGNNKRSLLLPGAIWFIEGVAHVVARLTTTDFDLSTYANIGLADYDKQRVPNLSDLEHYGRLKENRQDVYSLGELAAAHLIAKHGLEVVSALFQALGEEQSWYAAFLQVTGQTPQSFYESFYENHNAQQVVTNNGYQLRSLSVRRPRRIPKPLNEQNTTSPLATNPIEPRIRLALDRAKLVQTELTAPWPPEAIPELPKKGSD